MSRRRGKVKKILKYWFCTHLNEKGTFFNLRAFTYEDLERKKQESGEPENYSEIRLVRITYTSLSKLIMDILEDHPESMDGNNIREI